MFEPQEKVGRCLDKPKPTTRILFIDVNIDLLHKSFASKSKRFSGRFAVFHGEARLAGRQVLPASEWC